MTKVDDQPKGTGNELKPPLGIRTNQMLDDEAKEGGQGSPNNDGSPAGSEAEHLEAEGGQGDRGEDAPAR